MFKAKLVYEDKNGKQYDLTDISLYSKIYNDPSYKNYGGVYILLNRINHINGQNEYRIYCKRIYFEEAIVMCTAMYNNNALYRHIPCPLNLYSTKSDDIIGCILYNKMSDIFEFYSINDKNETSLIGYTRIQGCIDVISKYILFCDKIISS